MIDEARIIEIKEDILSDNNTAAASAAGYALR